MSYKKAVAYINENLGFVTDLGQIDDTKMPLYLKSEFEYHRISVIDRNLVLASLMSTDDVTIDRIKNRRIKINQYLNNEESIVFVFDDINNYLRRRLIEEKISFIILGKMIFILELGTVFSERTIAKFSRQINQKSEQLKPATQALLLYLLRTQDFSSSMAEIAENLCVSVMSVSRAFQELKRFGLLKVIEGSDKESYTLNGKRDEVWKIAVSYMVNPVSKSVYLDPESISKAQRSLLTFSGETALSKYSMLSAPASETFGIRKSEFMDNFKKVTPLPIKEQNSMIVQLFKIGRAHV